MSRGEKSIQGQQFSFHFINKRHYSLYSSISISIYESFAPNGAAQHHPLYVYDCWWYGKIRKRKGHEHHRLFSSNIAHNSSFISSYIFLNRTQKNSLGMSESICQKHIRDTRGRVREEKAITVSLKINSHHFYRNISSRS